MSWLRGGVRILMYHAIGREGEEGSTYVVPARALARQLALVERLGFRVVPLDAYVAARVDGRVPPRRAVVLTFDDGYADLADIGADLLRERGCPATVFVSTGWIGETERMRGRDPLLPRPLLSWRDVERLGRAGIAVGGHGETHAPLTRMPAERARAEVVACAAGLAARHVAARPVLAFPHGDHDPEIAALAADAGFVAAVTSSPGVNDPGTPLHALRRIEVRGTMSTLRFLVALLLGRATLLPHSRAA